MQADGLAGRVAVVEVVALQDAGDGEVGEQLEQGLHVQIEDPLGVVAQDGLLGIEDFEGLVHVCLGVLLDLVAGELRARGIAAGRVADEGGAVADDKRDLMAQILELAQLAQGHGVADVDVGGRGIHAELDVQGHATLEFLQKRGLGNDVRRAGLDDVQLFLRSKHEAPAFQSLCTYI